MGRGLSEAHSGAGGRGIGEMKPLISMVTDGGGVESPREPSEEKLSLMLEGC